MGNELEVLLGGRVAGHLVEAASGWSFVYGAEARAAGSGLPHPVALGLPRDRETFHGESVRAVFANLLPDGELRRRLAQSLGLSEANEFALLGRIAGDCPGAIRLRWPGTQAAPAGLRPLSDVELRNAMAVLPAHPLLEEADGLRMSLPGEFDKLPVRVVDGQVALVLGEGLTTHILKPARPGLRESVMNEAYVTALAAAVGLSVAPSEVIHGQIAVLNVTRIDRDVSDQVRARHMEDFCQIGGLPATRKYEREGGLRLHDIVGFLRRYSGAPALDIRALIRWAIFSFMAGFGAGHAKQLALLYGAQGPRLAPFFGLWSTHVYNEMNYRMGFSIGGEDRPDWLTAARWSEFAQACGVRPAYVLDELRTTATTLPRIAAQLAESFQRRNGFANVIRQIRVVVEQRARQALVSLEAERANPITAGSSAIDRLDSTNEVTL